MEAIADYTGLRPHGSDGTAFVVATPPDRLGVPGPVILSVVGGPLDDRQLGRLTEELQRVAAVSSPFLVRVLEVGHLDGGLIYAVEHLSMGTLAEPDGELEPSGTLKVVADAARGAHALHEAGIAHSAISPATIALHEEGAKLGVPDLGRIAHPGRTVAAGASVDAVECWDPDVLRGGRPGRASDVWSLGATLHRAVTGRSLYGEELPADGLAEAVHRLLSARPVLAEGLDPALAAVVARCLAADPDERPRNASSVARRLDELA